MRLLITALADGDNRVLLADGAVELRVLATDGVSARMCVVLVVNADLIQAVHYSNLQ